MDAVKTGEVTAVTDNLVLALTTMESSMPRRRRRRRGNEGASNPPRIGMMYSCAGRWPRSTLQAKQAGMGDLRVRGCYAGILRPNGRSIMAGKMRAVGIAWFRPEDYQRIREMSDDDMDPTFEKFEARMAAHLERLPTTGVVYEKVIIDPDELLAYVSPSSGRARRRIDSQARSRFASLLIARKYGSKPGI